MLFDKTSYKIHTDKIVYEPTDMTTQKAIKMAGRISAFENLPVELHIQESVYKIQLGKLQIEKAIMMIDKNEVPPEIDYTEYWETRDGDLIRYADMTDNHLINAHNMIERQVCDFINRCANRNEEQGLPEYIEQMINGLETEMEKRNLITKGGDNE